MFLIIAAASAMIMAPPGRKEELPNWSFVTSAPAGSTVSNEVRLDSNRLLWNGQEASESRVGEYLRVVREMQPQPPTVLSYGAGVSKERLQRARMLIDNVLQCRPSTCIEVTQQIR